MKLIKFLILILISAPVDIIPLNPFPVGHVFIAVPAVAQEQRQLQQQLCSDKESVSKNISSTFARGQHLSNMFTIPQLNYLLHCACAEGCIYRVGPKKPDCFYQFVTPIYVDIE